MDKPEIDPKTGLWKEPQPYETDGLDYETDYWEHPSDYMADVDDQYAHHFTTGQPMAHYFKYHEEEILKDIQEYVSGTYQGHYTGTKHEFRKSTNY